MKVFKKIEELASNFTAKYKKEPKLKITDIDDDSEVLTIDKIGISDLGMGVVILKTNNGKEFPISAFSAETAKSISDFQEGKINEIPSMYNMAEQICEELEMQLVKVRIYDNGNALRANLYFRGKKDIVLRNYRSSDAIALAVLYRIPILIKKNLLEQTAQIQSK